MTDFEPTELVETFGLNGAETPLISVLEQIQARHHYLPREAMILVSERMGLPLSQVYSVATFYNAFNLERHGRHGVCVCVGTACHVRGAQRILERLEEKLGIEPGETTPDWEYSLDTVHCLGACALGPIVVVDDEYSGQMHPKKVDELLARVKQADEVEA
ncbi:MAG: NAD(P)H-dependent oxidoreductase subunit E [Chloroflexi bacterium]|nr:MAG: NAD(P)H-dependent oxidoreductase subunit E [Chloroflexota bacterium]